jgi:hypothetical protein
VKRHAKLRLLHFLRIECAKMPGNADAAQA